MITEDEVMRLLERADPARRLVVAPAVDAAAYLAGLGTRSSNVTLIDTEPTPTRPPHRRRWPVIVVAAAAVATIVVGGLVLATRDDDASEQIPAAPTTSQTRTEPSTNPAAAPVEFTACVGPGPKVHGGTVELSEVSVPDGVLRIARLRGDTWQLSVSDVSDPRLDGTWYVAKSEDQYNLPYGFRGHIVVTWTHRVETDEGAWQGSSVEANVSGHERTGFQYVLVGEGAYEGLTAIAVSVDDDCPSMRGAIIEGGVPAPPVPQAG